MLSALGAQVRTLRKQRGFTLERFSELSGLSTGLVSQVERGMANPSFATLAQLAHGLGISVARLLHVSDGSRSPVVRRAERRRIDGHGVGVASDAVYELLTSDLQGALEVLWLETMPGHDTSATPFTHNGEEAGVVLTGSLDVYLDGVPHHLEAGDSIQYSSTLSHWYRNVGDGPCTAIWVITPPSW
jgi:transcriptional regulator with XRE-family HTH domain